MEDLVLIDTGGSLHKYESDVTRVGGLCDATFGAEIRLQTFALAGSVIGEEHARIWETVSKVQRYALEMARKGVEARMVDEAAREYMERQQAGMSRFFSHRLGHGGCYVERGCCLQLWMQESGSRDTKHPIFGAGPTTSTG